MRIKWLTQLGRSSRRRRRKICLNIFLLEAGHRLVDAAGQPGLEWHEASGGQERQVVPGQQVELVEGHGVEVDRGDAG